MERTRDEERLFAIRLQIDALSVVSRDDFNIPARYSSLVKLEAILAQRVDSSRHCDRDTRERAIGRQPSAVDPPV